MCVYDVCGFSECCLTHAETTFTQWKVNGMRLNGLPTTPSSLNVSQTLSHQCLKAFPVM